MKQSDSVFLAAVIVVAGLFAAKSLREAGEVLAARRAAEQVQFGVAGQPRDVNMERLMSLIRSGELSNHEAEFYRPVREGEAIELKLQMERVGGQKNAGEQ